MPTLEELDAQIAELEGQIAAAQQGGGEAGPDYSAFFKSPGYEFRLGEGVRAIDRSASARGVLLSPSQGRELQRYGQGVAASEFNTYADRLASLAGIGQSATQYSGALGSEAAGQVGRSYNDLAETTMAGGTARASGYIGASNALLQGFGGAANAFSNWRWPGSGGGTRGWQSQPYSGTDINWLARSF